MDQDKNSVDDYTGETGLTMNDKIRCPYCGEEENIALIRDGGSKYCRNCHNYFHNCIKCGILTIEAFNYKGCKICRNKKEKNNSFHDKGCSKCRYGAIVVNEYEKSTTIGPDFSCPSTKAICNPEDNYFNFEPLKDGEKLKKYKVVKQD